MARTLPPMLQVMKDVGGVEIPEYLAKLTADADSRGSGSSAGKAGAPASKPGPKDPAPSGPAGTKPAKE